jgi:hypothetical protein
MAIFVPKGGISDYTPQLVESNAIHNILRKAGCSEMSLFSGINLKDQYLNFDIQKVLGDAFPKPGERGSTYSDSCLPFILGMPIG